ncbi:MAG: hypothetical protein EZS28_056243 [Streblomastix strix]|uniref:Uncharacterized protein n=1 Tax=Streblomastix strix TaxID=222440 RepID=A0A5J4PNS2_9EUKA|nr:MAG: hypothetical protein EZS28_056243 [Streblomastix strix]
MQTRKRTREDLLQAAEQLNQEILQELEESELLRRDGLQSLKKCLDGIAEEWKPALSAVGLSFMSSDERKQNKILGLSRQSLRTAEKRYAEQNFTSAINQDAFVA